MTVVEKKKNELTAKMVLSDKHKRDIGIVHGGAICALYDMAMKSLLLEEDESMKITSSKIHFLKPGKGSYLKAVAKCEFLSGPYRTINCYVYDDQDNIIAFATALAGKSIEHKGTVFDQHFIEYTDQELDGELAQHVLENDTFQPFRDHLNVRRTIWRPNICEMKVELTQQLKEPNGSIPHSLIPILTDMAAGQVVKTLLVPIAYGLTLEITSWQMSEFADSKELIIRARGLNEGKIINSKTIIYDEQQRIVGMAATTYYTKKNK